MQPYVQNQTGYMMGGILADLGRGLEERTERRKQEVARVKAAEAFLKSLPDDVRGIQPEDLAMMSGPDKLAAMVGVIEGQKAKLQDAQLKQFTAQQIAGEQAGQREAMLDAQRAQFNQALLPRIAAIGQPPKEKLQDFYENATDESQRPQRVVPPQVLLLEEAARAGALDPTRLDPDALLKATEAKDGVDWEAIRPREGRTSSGREYIYGRSGQFQTLDQPGSPDQPVERKLSDGTLQVWTGKAWQTVRQPGQIDPDDQLRSLTAQYSALIDRRRYAEADAVHRQIQALMGGRGPTEPDATPSVPAAAPPAKPASKGKLTVEQAREFLKQAAGDKEKARSLAREQGFEF